MAPLLDIFSNPPSRIKKEVVRPLVRIDYREKNCLVPAILHKEGLEVKFMELKVADYLVGSVAIERKTVNDFLSSMINKRLLRQLEDLKQHTNPLLIIEGIEEQELYEDSNGAGINANAIRGFLLSITLRHKIPIIFTKNYKDTARFISVIAKKKDTEMSLNITKKALSKKETLQFILEGFPGIGPKTSKKLLKKFKTLKKIFNTSQEDLKEILGKKAGIFNLVEESY